MPPQPDAEWTRSDLYHNSFLIAPDDALDHARKNSNEQGLPEIAVSAAQGKLLNLQARSIGAKRILEVGTLGGYSTVWLSRALPDDGELVTFELSEKHAKILRSVLAPAKSMERLNISMFKPALMVNMVAQENIDYAGLTSKVKIVVGPAAESLKQVPSEPKWDLIFIDADKPGNLTYVLEAKRLVRKGGVIIVDNVVRQGRVADPDDNDANIEGVRKLLEHLKTDKDIDATTIATVGEKGYDGFLFGIRL